MRDPRPIFLLSLFAALAVAMVLCPYRARGSEDPGTVTTVDTQDSRQSKPNPDPPALVHQPGHCYRNEKGYPPSPLFCCFAGDPKVQLNGYCWNGKQDF